MRTISIRALIEAADAAPDIADPTYNFTGRTFFDGVAPVSEPLTHVPIGRSSVSISELVAAADADNPGPEHGYIFSNGRQFHDPGYDIDCTRRLDASHVSEGPKASSSRTVDGTVDPCDLEYPL